MGYESAMVADHHEKPAKLLAHGLARKMLNGPDILGLHSYIFGADNMTEVRYAGGAEMAFF